MIVGLGFVVLESDTCIYIRGEIIIEVYLCYNFYLELCQHFSIEDKGAIKSFLGLNVIRNWENHTISINQPGYIDR